MQLRTAQTTRVRTHARPHQIDVSGVPTISFSKGKGKLSKVKCLSLLLIGIPEDCRIRIHLFCRWLNLAPLRRELLCAVVRRHTCKFPSVRCRQHLTPTLLRGNRSVPIASVFIRAIIYQPPSKIMVSKIATRNAGRSNFMDYMLAYRRH